jgi:hypothetical protein
MDAKVAALKTKQPRFIDPRAALEDQLENLKALIKDPPENGRWVTFTPKLAQWVIDNLNQRNRRKRINNIKRFSEAMKAGNWSRTGDSVKFSKEGNLLDGQNRLFACVLSGKAFTTLVVFGIEEEAFAMIDTNAKRTGADTLRIEGIAHERIIAPAVRWLMIGEERGQQVANDQLLEYYRDHIDEDAMQLAAQRAKAAGRLLPTGSLAALLYQFEKKSTRTCAIFAADLKAKARGCLKLFKAVTKLRQQNMNRVNELQLRAMIINTWNCYREDKSVTVKEILWNLSNDFPTIK